MVTQAAVPVTGETVKEDKTKGSDKSPVQKTIERDAVDIAIFQRPFTEWPLDVRFRYCEYLAEADDSLPVAYRNKPRKIFYAAERGARLGLSPTEAISSILVVNGATSVWGDMGMALVRKSGLLASYDEWYEVDGVRQEGDNFDIIEEWKAGKKIVAFVTMQRKGEPAKTVSYSVQDAIDAGLWAMKDTWKKSPKRMLMWRPRSFCMRDKFQDVLMGFVTVEEARDIMPEAERGPIAEASQPGTKGAALAETLGGKDSGLMTTAQKEEIEMVESILAAGGRENSAAAAAIALQLPPEEKDITEAQAALYLRALNSAVDQMTEAMDQKTAAERGSLL